MDTTKTESTSGGNTSTPVNGASSTPVVSTQQGTFQRRPYDPNRKFSSTRTFTTARDFKPRDSNAAPQAFTPNSQNGARSFERRPFNPRFNRFAQDTRPAVAAPVAKVEKPARDFTEIAIPDIKEFLKAGAQFGHQKNKWNPRMSKYIFGEKNGLHILDLNKTLEGLRNALSVIQKAAYQGDILFVGTKTQTQDIVEREAKRAGAYFVTHRWAGGTLTNSKLIKEKSLKKLVDVERQFEEGVIGRTKQEISWMKKDWQKLTRLFGGVKTMMELPKAIFVIDANFEAGAVREARSLGIPVIAMVDTNSDPTGVDYVIPVNDDAEKSIELVVKLVADAVLDGNQGKGIVHINKDYSKMEIKKIS